MLHGTAKKTMSALSGVCCPEKIKNKKQTCSKPGSVLTVIYLSGLPMRHRRVHLKPVYLALLRVGFTSPEMSPFQAVSSYLTFSPLLVQFTVLTANRVSGLFSAALSVGSLPLGVTQHPAL